MDFLNQKAISANLLAKDKEGVIGELVDLLIKVGETGFADSDSGLTEQKGVLVKILMEREALGSTGIGQGIAIPHGKS